MPKPKVLTQRSRELMLIHMGRKQLGMEDEENDHPIYRDMLFALTGKRSAAEIGDRGRAQVLEHMIASGARLKWNRRAAVAQGDAKDPLIRKVRALLLSLGNYGDQYADGIARRMHKVDRFEWCNAQQLRGIVAALSKQLDKVRAGA